MVATTTRPDETSPDGRKGPPGPRSVRPRRGLPGSRAVVGGLLVTVAAVGTFAAYTSATGGPDTSYVVAAGDVEVGDVLSAADLEVTPLDLERAVADRAFVATEDLVGAVTLAPLGAGELVQVSSVRRGEGAGDGLPPQISFAIEPDRAVAGDLVANERVDVLATYGSGETAVTQLVVQGARLVGLEEGGGSLAGSGGLTVTLALGSTDEVLRLANAVDAAMVTLVRTTGVPAGDEEVDTSFSADDLPASSTTEDGDATTTSTAPSATSTAPSVPNTPTG